MDLKRRFNFNLSFISFLEFLELWVNSKQNRKTRNVFS